MPALQKASRCAVLLCFSPALRVPSQLAPPAAGRLRSVVAPQRSQCSQICLGMAFKGRAVWMHNLPSPPALQFRLVLLLRAFRGFSSFVDKEDQRRKKSLALDLAQGGLWLLLQLSCFCAKFQLVSCLPCPYLLTKCCRESAEESGMFSCGRYLIVGLLQIFCEITGERETQFMLLFFLKFKHVCKTKTKRKVAL